VRGGSGGGEREREEEKERKGAAVDGWSHGVVYLEEDV
jgi:hypothetical protein